MKNQEKKEVRLIRTELSQIQSKLQGFIERLEQIQSDLQERLDELQFNDVENATTERLQNEIDSFDYWIEIINNTDGEIEDFVTETESV